MLSVRATSCAVAHEECRKIWGRFLASLKLAPFVLASRGLGFTKGGGRSVARATDTQVTEMSVRSLACLFKATLTFNYI